MSSLQTKPLLGTTEHATQKSSDSILLTNEQFPDTNGRVPPQSPVLGDTSASATPSAFNYASNLNYGPDGYNPERYFSFTEFPGLGRFRFIFLLVVLHMLCGLQMATGIVMAFLLVPLHNEFHPTLTLLALVPALRLLGHSMIVPFVLRWLQPHARIDNTGSLEDSAHIDADSGLDMGAGTANANLDTELPLESLQPAGAFLSMGIQWGSFGSDDMRRSRPSSRLQTCFAGACKFKWLRDNMGVPLLIISVFLAFALVMLGVAHHFLLAAFSAGMIGLFSGALLSFSRHILAEFAPLDMRLSDRINLVVVLSGASSCGAFFGYATLSTSSGDTFLSAITGLEPYRYICHIFAALNLIYGVTLCILLRNLGPDPNRIVASIRLRMSVSDIENSISTARTATPYAPHWFQLVLSPRSPLLHSSLATWLFNSKSQNVQSFKVSRLPNISSRFGSLHHQSAGYLLDPTFMLSVFMGSMGCIAYESMVFFPMCLKYADVDKYIIGVTVGIFFAAGSIGGVLGRYLVSVVYKKTGRTRVLLFCGLFLLIGMVPFSFFNIILLPTTGVSTIWMLPLSSFLVPLIYNAFLEAIVLLSICVSIPPKFVDEAAFWDATIEGITSSLGPLAVGVLTEHWFGFEDNINPLDDTNSYNFDENKESLQRGIFWVTTVCWSLASLAGLVLCFSKKFRPIISTSEWVL